jgi:hypothetical protein
MERDVKFKKLFDFSGSGFYNLRKRVDQLVKREVMER